MIDITKIKEIVKQTKFSKADIKEIGIVYSDATALGGKRRILDEGCSSCVQSAIKIINNYINYHHVETKPVVKKENVTKITVQIDCLSDLTYSELISQAKERNIPFKRNISKVKLIELLK
jgi:uncharacterized protein (UPF0248 family)